MIDLRERQEILRSGLARAAGRRGRGPRGFSLLEVVLALAIFFMSAAALSQLLRAGTAAATWGDRLTEATLRCESKLSEIVASPERPRSETATVSLDDEDWESEVEVAPTGVPGLLRVTATVRHVSGDERDVEVSLVRLLAHSSGLEAPQAAAALAPAAASSLSVEQMLGIEGAGQ